MVDTTMSARQHPPVLDDDGLARAPQPAPLWHELRVVSEASVAIPGALLSAIAAPVGPPRPVLVLPGFASGDGGTLLLRLYLRSIGHHASGWGIGVNTGASNYIGQGLDRKLQEMTQQFGCPIDIVGWSAGGLMGRMLAANRSELVRQVISLGSPVKLGRNATNIGRLVRTVTRFVPQQQRPIEIDHIPVPSTTIWSAGDGVVPGEVCRQTVGRFAESVEVRGSHLGLVLNPSVLYVIADRLACPADAWTPFDPPRHLRWMYPSIDNAATAGAGNED